MLLNRPYLNLTRVNPLNDQYFELTISFILDERRRLSDIIDEGVKDDTRYMRITYFASIEDMDPDSVNSVTTVQRYIMREESEKYVRVYLDRIYPPYAVGAKGELNDYPVPMALDRGPGNGSTGSYHP